jgi:hypothetical protein
MKKFLRSCKSSIRSFLKKVIGINELDRRITRLEEITTNMDIGMQVENGLRYLEHIQSTAIIDKDSKRIKNDTETHS